MIHNYLQMPREQREKGAGSIYIFGLICIGLLLILTAVFGAIAYVHNTVSSLHNAVETAGRQALDQVVIPDLQGGQDMALQANVQQNFQTLLPKYLSKWPQSSYSIQSFQMFSESDRGDPAPSGFEGIVPGTSLFIIMNLKLSVLQGILPANHVTWTIPVKDTITSNTFYNPAHEWNPTRQSGS
ncbi:hypothetical protein Desaci_4100 [Desulfosporosinus acidiphilus SJ4]|uniref:Uncharacterized protein n=1 Tax=Desulfosporosinus acidiphilus (strain DSM 22704 / JCM 16185 / SJ4) TaxID=646529 RepID=I4DAY9_DESAJ|nr:hypothetical protein [Desulfosporosinus acidiphilus]AFM42963.1 hypothetical protein Desaci_4100 [Desulfosporosinus acidiphilus SJ4]